MQPSRVRLSFIEFVYGLTDEQCQVALALLKIAKAERGGTAPLCALVTDPFYSPSKN